jgi:electron-transferring-flavoprotein dehydrogenase
MGQSTSLSHGACLWNCSQANPENAERMNLAFRAGTGGLHSAEN